MAYDVATAFAKIEDEIRAAMIRKLKNHRVMEIAEDLEWAQWQVMQLKALEDYKKHNRKKFTGRFDTINQQIRRLIQDYYNDGATSQEKKILQAIKRGYKPPFGTNKPPYTGKTKIEGEFFKVNERKLNALIESTVHDMQTAETAVLRMANDRYREIIFDAQVYANAGGTTYAKAVDMATRDFLSAGLNCVRYRNGARHTISDYADMAIRTANKRAYLRGEGEKRQEWGIATVILNKRNGACPLCAPFCGQVFIDDVWSGGAAYMNGKERNLKPTEGLSPVTGTAYPLLSTAIQAGLYHPRCRDAHTTFFEGISTPPSGEKLTQEDVDRITSDYEQQQQKKSAKKQAEQMERMAKYSLDEENKKKYSARAEQWRDKEVNS